MESLEVIAKLLAISYLRYFVFAGTAFLVLYVFFSNYFRHLKIQSKHAGRKDFIREISNSLITAAIFAGAAYIFLYTELRDFSQLYTNTSDYAWWWMPLSVVVALIIHDTYFYWSHRIVHHPKLYKKVHLEHHKSVNPSPWTSYSFHFWEGILQVLILPLLIFIIPMHISMAIVFSTFVLIFNVLGHSGYEFIPAFIRKSPLFSIVASATYHNLHHEKYNCNYGLYFRWWDKWMGTEHPEYTETYDKVVMKKKSEDSISLKDAKALHQN
jgi:Delta7-sterol 5-desaturase